MSTLFPFGAALVSLRLAGSLRARGQTAWAGGLLAYGVAAGAMAWGSAHGWDARAFRVYYLAGGLLTVVLLGVGSLLLIGKRWAAPVGLLWIGLATGVVIEMSVHGTFGSGLPSAGAHVHGFPRALAIVGNSLGTLAVVGVALSTIRKRLLGNTLILAGIATAAAGSGISGIGASATAACILVASVLLYLGAGRSR